MATEVHQMADAIQESEISNFYRDKHILLTGATGFFGKLLIEKLLRVCKPKMIYLLIRSKKSCEPHKRLQALINNTIFDRLKEQNPNFMDHISAVSGDISEPGLDLLPSDRDILVENVQIVMHGAATVKFDEKLSLATKINVLGTKSILELCQKMTKLESVVHISTAFSNCNQLEIKEKFYESPMTSDNLIQLSECVKEDQLELMSAHIRNKWPNTYVFTKAVAEEAVTKYGRGLPISVFRPVVVISTKSEPVPGWSDNLYGPQGLTLGTGAGIVRVIRCDSNCAAELVPADYAVNCLLTVGYKTASVDSHLDIPIYNFSTDPENKITWGEYMKVCFQREKEVPLAMAIWYCTCVLVKNWFGFLLLTNILHNLPALFIDTGLLLMNKKPWALNIYKKIHKLENLLSFFSTRQWDFSRDNVDNLWKSLSETDKKLFPFDMKSLDYKAYLFSYVDGMRFYLGKEDVSTIPRGRRINKLRYVAHRSVQLVFSSSVIWCLWRVFSLIL
ncbi:unnamed protein product [Nezara viridula]|uniref:Fatty acyl-CoA reductase n=1 Tax=Nezara viridula TaxID=85310 RepID=A0A9P0H9L8_NEZVI|nr:unnamed protein product [Nezara viridula]